MSPIFNVNICQQYRASFQLQVGPLIRRTDTQTNGVHSYSLTSESLGLATLIWNFINKNHSWCYATIRVSLLLMHIKGDRNATQKLIYLFRHFHPKIRSLTCCALLACRGVWDLRKPHYKSHDGFEDTKGVIRIRKSKKDRQHNGQKKKDTWTNNRLTFKCRSGGVVGSLLVWFYHPPRENRLCKYAVIIISKCCLSVILIENETNRAHRTEYMNTGIVLSYLVVPIINSFIEVYC